MQVSDKAVGEGRRYAEFTADEPPQLLRGEAVDTPALGS
jgi:hypothetical protein